MAMIRFTDNIQRHVSCPPRQVEAKTVREALERYFEGNTRARGYVLNDLGRLRQHMAIFIDGQQIEDRDSLSDPVAPLATIDIVQALSGG